MIEWTQNDSHKKHTKNTVTRNEQENWPILYVADIKANLAKVAHVFLLDLKEVDWMVVDEKETKAALVSFAGVLTVEIALE